MASALAGATAVELIESRRSPSSLRTLAALHAQDQPPTLGQLEFTRRLADTSMEISDKAFLPHLTIGRVKMDGEGIDWPKLLQGVEVKRVRSIVDRVTLYRSQLSQFGPNYTGLVSAPLVGRAKNE